MPSEDFFIDHGAAQYERPTQRVQGLWDRAKRICEQCPVMRECARDSLGEIDGVWGGLDPAQRLELRGMHGRKVRALRGPKKLEYMALAWELKEGRNMLPMDIARTMGLSVSVVQYLLRIQGEYLEKQAQEKNATPPTVSSVVRPPWPRRGPDEGDGWVRYSGRVVRGYYVGQTEDDAWFLMKVPLSKEYSTAWFKAEDVHLTRKIPREVRRRAGQESRIYGTALKRYSEDVKQAG